MGKLTRPVDRQFASCVVLTGFRATGKTAVGAILADLLGYRFIDTDEVISNRLGCSITDSVSSSGWQPFRDFEQELLFELYGSQNTVIATGGGAVLHRKAWQKLRENSFVIWLQADVETIMVRLEGDSKTVSQRPSLGGNGNKMEIPTLLKKREPLYQSGSDMRVATEKCTPAELAATLYQNLTAQTNNE